MRLKKLFTLFVGILALPFFASASFTGSQVCNGGGASSTLPLLNASGIFNCVATSTLGFQSKLSFPLGFSQGGTGNTVTFASGTIAISDGTKLYPIATSSLGISGGGGTPADSNGAVQFNNSGAFGGDAANLYWASTDTMLGIGTNSPLARLHVIGKDLLLTAPSSFTASLVGESLIGAPSDSPVLTYGPLSTSGIASENPGYSGYTNNDSVDTFIYPYRFIAGQYWTASPGYLGNVTLSSNPSGIDDSWSPASTGDGGSVDGYIVNVVDNTMGTNYSYDVGGATSYADMNVGGTLTYADFCSSGCFTSSGQSFNFEPYNVATSPSGNGFYGSVSGGDFSINDSFSNGSQFWVQHNLSGNSGTGWARVFILDTTANNSGETTDTTFYQKGAFGGPGSLPYPQHYGFLSDGSELNRSYETYALQTSPSSYFSSGHSDSSTVDPNDGQYYITTFTIFSIGSGNSTRIIRDGATHYDVASYPFSVDEFGTTFVSGNTVTPIGFTSPAIIAQNSAGTYDQPAALQITSTGGAPTETFFDNSTERMRIGYDPATSNGYVKTRSGAFAFRDINNVTLATISPTSVVFNSPQASTFTLLARTAGISDFLGIFGSTNSMQVGGSAATNGYLNLAAGSSSKHQLTFSTTATSPTATSSGAMNFNGSNLFLDNSSFRARILQTGTASAISSGNFTCADANGNLQACPLSIIGGFSGTVIQSNLQFEAKQGIQIDSGKTLDMGTGANFTGNILFPFAVKTADFTYAISDMLNIATSTGKQAKLPTAVGKKGQWYAFKNESSGTSTVVTTGSQTLFGNSPQATTTMQAGDAAIMVSDGINWINLVPPNPLSGVVKLASGVATISNQTIDSRSVIQLTEQSACTGFPGVSGTTTTSFSIDSSVLTDTCMVGYTIFEHN